MILGKLKKWQKSGSTHFYRIVWIESYMNWINACSRKRLLQCICVITYIPMTHYASITSVLKSTQPWATFFSIISQTLLWEIYFWCLKWVPLSKWLYNTWVHFFCNVGTYVIKFVMLLKIIRLFIIWELNNLTRQQKQSISLKQ